MSEHGNGITRRGFRSVATVGVGAAIGGAVAVPAAWIVPRGRQRPVGDPGQLVRVTARRAAVARETVAETLVGLADRQRPRYHLRPGDGASRRAGRGAAAQKTSTR
jgi:hypothetical protein